MGLQKTTLIHGAVRLEFQLKIAHTPIENGDRRVMPVATHAFLS